jgi:hypothetical protein
VGGPSVRERLRWELTPEQYRRIRRLWIRHSLAEERRDIDGLVATLAPDCVYEIVPTAQRWTRHQGARTFYRGLFEAFADNAFALKDIVIGPQGVFEVATLTATNLGPWAGMPASGPPVRIEVLIYFPWDREAGLFAGERIWLGGDSQRQALFAGSG